MISSHEEKTPGYEQKSTKLDDSVIKNNINKEVSKYNKKDAIIFQRLKSFPVCIIILSIQSKMKKRKLLIIQI